MTGHFLLWDAEATQRFYDGRIGHWPAVATRTWEQQSTLTRERAKLPKDLQRLPGEWDNVIHARLGDPVTPFCRVKVDVLPLSRAELTGPNEQQGSEAQGTDDGQRAGVAIHQAKDRAKSLGIRYGRKMAGLSRRQRAAEIARGVALAAPGRHTIAEDSAEGAQRARGGFESAAPFDPTND